MTERQQRRSCPAQHFQGKDLDQEGARWFRRRKHSAAGGLRTAQVLRSKRRTVPRALLRWHF